MKQFDLVFRRDSYGARDSASTYVVELRTEAQTLADRPTVFLGWVDKVDAQHWTAVRPDMTTVSAEVGPSVPDGRIHVRFFGTRQEAGEYLARTRVRQG